MGGEQLLQIGHPLVGLRQLLAMSGEVVVMFVVAAMETGNRQAEKIVKLRVLIRDELLEFREALNRLL